MTHPRPPRSLTPLLDPAWDNYPDAYRSCLDPSPLFSYSKADSSGGACLAGPDDLTLRNILPFSVRSA